MIKRTIASTLAYGQSKLNRRDARYLLAHLMDLPESTLISHGEIDVPDPVWERYQTDIGRIEEGEPLAYVVGFHNFMGYRFRVTPDTLIPRPETELLVEEGLSFLRPFHGKQQDGKQKMRIIDVGTGSGCIAITLSLLCQCTVIAADISWAALKVAQQNNATHRSDVSFFLSDLLGSTNQQFDLIIANLPYVAQSETNVMDPSVITYEPKIALFSPDEGLAHIRDLLDQSRSRIAPGGMILLEFGYRQGERVRRLATDRFPQARIDILRDFSDHYRILKIEIK